MFKNLNPETLGISGQQSEVIELALSFGFKGIDLNAVDFAAQVKTHGMPHARRLLDSAKLKIGSCLLPLDWSGDDASLKQTIEQIPAWAQPAAELGCTRCITYIPPASDARPYHQNFEFYRQRLNEVAKKLEPLGMRLGVGFQAAAELRQGKQFQFIHDFNSLQMLLGMVGNKSLGVVVDLWQLYVCGAPDVYQKLSVEQILSVQLADAPQQPAASELPLKARLLPGESGAIDSAAVLAWLAEKGYQGPVTPAAHGSRFAGMKREASVKLAGEKLDQVWKAAGLNPAGKLAMVKR